MRFRRLELVCECGQAAKGVQELGFTSEYELVVHWTCTQCRKQAFLVKSLSDCCKQCPEQEETSVFDARAEDERFLLSLGIRP